jgi:TnpA family transposase
VTLRFDVPHEPEQTRTDHLAKVRQALGFRDAGPAERRRLVGWLLERAMEHERPALLLQLACERLLADRVVRPGVTQLERLVAAVREQATGETYRRLQPLLAAERIEGLDRLLRVDPALGCCPLVWLRTELVSVAAKAILAELDKLAWLRKLGADALRRDLAGVLPANRVAFLAALGRRTSPQALSVAAAERRYPILLCFCADQATRITDDLIDAYDRALAGTDRRARHDLDELRRSSARSTNDKVLLFVELGRAILDAADGRRDNDGAGADVLDLVERRIGLERLRGAVAEAETLARPRDDGYVDLLDSRYSHLRQFVPDFLAAFDFRATPNSPGEQVLAAVEVLRELNRRGRRRVPDDAPLGFVPAKWHAQVVGAGGRIDRHVWELSVLFELRGALRAANVWLDGSRRYADPDTYLLAPAAWPALRDQVCADLDLPHNGAERLREYEAELHARLRDLDDQLPANQGVRIDGDRLVVTPLKAEELDGRVEEVAGLVAGRLPKVELADLLIEVDRDTGFSDHLTHAGGATARSKDLKEHLYAAIVAQATNLGPTTMAEITEGVSYRQLAWATDWYLREETLKQATAAIVNHQHRQPLAGLWGTGSFSSSDGQRFPVAVKAAGQATSLLPPRYGRGLGRTFYTWTSDQHAQYGTKVIAPGKREATYALDEILDNVTDLKITEHTTDTAGQTDLLFGLADLVGLQYSPNIRDLADQRLYRLGPRDAYRAYRHVGVLLKARVDHQRILARWDDLVRVAGSLRRGTVPASLLVSRLQAAPRQNDLTRAIQEYGRLVKTLFILRYLASEELRRRIKRQGNKQESLHALRDDLMFAHGGQLRHRATEDQANQASCLNLVVNAIVCWNTLYMADAIDALRADGLLRPDDDLTHLSPTVNAHINAYGRYDFAVERELARTGRRPLRRPDAASVG